MKDKTHRFFHNYYYLIHIITGAVLFLFGIEYFLAFLIVPAVVSFHIAQIQVGLLHLKLPGSFRNYSNLESYNIPWLKPLLLGEELHNNHHANPSHVNRGEHYGIKEYDPLYQLIIKPFFKYN